MLRSNDTFLKTYIEFHSAILRLNTLVLIFIMKYLKLKAYDDI